MGENAAGSRELLTHKAGVRQSLAFCSEFLYLPHRASFGDVELHPGGAHPSQRPRRSAFLPIPALRRSPRPTAHGGVLFTTILKFMPDKGEAMPAFRPRANTWCLPLKPIQPVWLRHHGERKDRRRLPCFCVQLSRSPPQRLLHRLQRHGDRTEGCQHPPCIR